MADSGTVRWSWMMSSYVSCSSDMTIRRRLAVESDDQTDNRV
jgi:hypothetical protein